MPQRFLPVMRRADLLTDRIDASLTEAFSKVSNLRGITVSLWVDGEQALPCLAPIFLMQSESYLQQVTWQAMRDRGEIDPILSTLALDIMDTCQIQGRVESVVNILPIGIGSHFIDMHILPNCVILHHSDLNAMVNDNHGYFAEESLKETTVAPLCTVILSKSQTAHETIAEAQSLQEDLLVFRKLAADALTDIDEIHDLRLGNPTVTELRAVETLDIH